MDELQNKSTMDFRDADIILSTIHSAIDIRNDNVVIFFRNLSENDAALYRVAMSRANKTAYVIFVNNGTMTTKFQRYLTLFTTTCV
jgi:DNA-binding beta-propeller fold protein YncE